MIEISETQMKHLLDKARTFPELSSTAKVTDVEVSPHGNIEINVDDCGQPYLFLYCAYTDLPEHGWTAYEGTEVHEDFRMW